MNKAQDVRKKTSRAGWVKYLIYLLVVLWMLLIFCMSAQPGDVSGDISGGVSHLFMKIWNRVFAMGWDEGTILQMAELWDYPIRKLAHMTEFGILAGLVYWALGYYFYDRPPKREVKKIRYPLAFVLAAGYAMTDEIHQLFVPDRSAQIGDVLIDSCGILIALLLLWGVGRLLQWGKNLKLKYRKR